MSNAKHTPMDAAAVAAYAAAKWPSAMQSPFALAVKSITARDEAERHAVECLAACDGWDEETLSHNIESNSQNWIRMSATKSPAPPSPKQG